MYHAKCILESQSQWIVTPIDHWHVVSPSLNELSSGTLVIFVFVKKNYFHCALWKMFHFHLSLVMWRVFFGMEFIVNSVMKINPIQLGTAVGLYQNLSENQLRCCAPSAFLNVQNLITLFFGIFFKNITILLLLLLQKLKVPKTLFLFQSSKTSGMVSESQVK